MRGTQASRNPSTVRIEVLDEIEEGVKGRGRAWSMEVRREIWVVTDERS